MTYYYTLAPIAFPPVSLASRFPNPATVAAWNRYGSYCPDTVPAYIIPCTSLPKFNVDVSDARIIAIDPDSEFSTAMQVIKAVAPYLFEPTADKPIVMDQAIGSAMHASPVFRLIDFNYEDTSEGKKQLEADCQTATGFNLDLNQSLETLKQEVWNAVRIALIAQ
ncbi:hypothetical protein QKW35_20625 [Pontibacterium granulatum]|uniref:hypothetical protein n=1 Tax=Pontibacterium granulatum TaxID=2036029 RepID=UPI00249AA9E4|nr:hypothetical protein [Pontibacterium granulatum]MDI3326789.1 hypothetical protein [Pontibacterium granulatum]